ncbi:MAG: metal-dependent hydrolase [Candidatus Hodarchaeales archaeon]|jgi:membrane-bound metal-dependent hydrolase YbcI (DUF457 family)
MYLLVHVTGALTAGLGLEYYRKKTVNWENKYILLLIASMIPDIVDKTIGAFVFKTGRWIGHSILFIIVIGLVYYFLAKKREERKEESQLIALGGIMHLLLDLPGISLDLKLILWPLFGWIIPEGRTEAFLEGGVTPLVIGTELVALLTLLLLAKGMRFNRKQYSVIGGGVVSYVASYIVLYAIIIGY